MTFVALPIFKTVFLFGNICVIASAMGAFMTSRCLAAAKKPIRMKPPIAPIHQEVIIARMTPPPMPTIHINTGHFLMIRHSMPYKKANRMKAIMSPIIISMISIFMIPGQRYVFLV